MVVLKQGEKEDAQKISKELASKVAKVGSLISLIFTVQAAKR